MPVEPIDPPKLPKTLVQKVVAFFTKVFKGGDKK